MSCISRRVARPICVWSEPMRALLLPPRYMVTTRGPRQRANGPAWAYDALLEGLLSGHISGRAMRSPDAKLLVDLLENLGWEPDATRLTGAMPYLTERLTMPVLRNVMRSLGFSSRSKMLYPQQLKDHPAPAVLCDADAQLWSVSSIFNEMGETPDEAENSRPVLKTNRRCKVVDFAPLSERQSSANAGAQDRFLFDTLARFAPDLRLSIILTLLSGVLAVTFALMVIFLFDLVVSGQQPQAITSLLFAAAALFGLELTFRHIKARLLGRISGRFEYLLGSGLFSKLLKLPPHMIDNAPVRDQTERLRDMEGLRDIAVGPFVIVMLELPATLLMLGAIALLAPPLALALLVLCLLFLGTSLTLLPMLAKRAQLLSQRRRAVMRHRTELIEKRGLIARNGLATPWQEKSQRAVNDMVAARFRLSRVHALLEALSYLFMPVAAASVIFLGAGRAMSGVMTGGELIAATMLTWRAIAPVQQGLLILPKLRDLKRLLRQVDMVMAFPEEQKAAPEPETVAEDAGRLVASNVFLRGSGSQIPALAGITLDVPKRAFVAVTGASGSGKSALLRVLSGQIAPQSGVIRLNDVNLQDFSTQALSRRVMLIPSRPLLIYGTLAQNMRFTDPMVSDTEIESLLDEVGLAKRIAELEDGIHTRIDPSMDSTNLNGGVRFALGVAQAFLTAPSLLLIDEPAEDVDPEIDAAITEALTKRRGEMTCLVVTHRPSLIRRSDAIIQLSGGRAKMKFLEQQREKVV